MPVDKSPQAIAGMFDAIAGRYDVLNTVLSGGLDRYWRFRAIRSLGLTGRERLLDVCTGTADVAIAGARLVASSGLDPSRVHVHTDVEDDEFLEWIAASDVAVDLRFPHRGEVSGSLARSMQVGRPTLVSATGTYLDVPEGLVVRVSAGRPDPSEIAGVIRTLLEDEGTRRAMGDAARAHMLELASTERTAHVYAEAIDGTLGLLRDPTRRALARWGGALVDLGVTEDALGEGYGVSYARALEEFRAPAST